MNNLKLIWETKRISKVFQKKIFLIRTSSMSGATIGKCTLSRKTQKNLVLPRYQCTKEVIIVYISRNFHIKILIWRGCVPLNFINEKKPRKIEMY